MTTTPAVVEIATAIDAAEGLKFAGIQAYQGAMQHLDSYEERKRKSTLPLPWLRMLWTRCAPKGWNATSLAVAARGPIILNPPLAFITNYNGSYAFMDADYGRILDKDGKRIDQGEWENAMFILTSVMSHAKADKAIVDAGLKVQSVDSGLPVIYGRDDVEYVKCSTNMAL